MTTVAYCNKIIASDSAVLINDSYINGAYKNKIGKTPSGCLYGFSGDLELYLYFMQWVKSGEKLSSTLTIPRHIRGSCEILYVTPPGKVYRICRDLTFTVEQDYAAVGSGSLLAIGAMGCGVGAIKAVRVACKHDPLSVLPVVFRRL